MATPISFHPITMRLLTMMLVASLLLTGIVVTSPEIARAEWYCTAWQYQGRYNVSCGANCGAWAGWTYGCWTNLYKRECCNAYECYETQWMSVRVCGCPC